MSRAALALCALTACQPGELVLPLPSSNDALAAAVSTETLYALSTQGAVLRRKLPSLEEPHVPKEIAPALTLSSLAFASSGAAYFVVERSLVRVLGFENSRVETLDIEVLAPENVTTAGTSVYVSTEREGLKGIDETSANVSALDPGVRGPIAADETYVYFESEAKLRRTSRKNGSRDPTFSVDVPSGLHVQALVQQAGSLVAALANDASTRERTLHRVTPTGLLAGTAGVSVRASGIVVDSEHIYYCAPSASFARIPIIGGKAQIFAVGNCPFALDATYVYTYGSDGIRRVRKSALPR